MTAHARCPRGSSARRRAAWLAVGSAVAMAWACGPTPSTPAAGSDTTAASTTGVPDPVTSSPGPGLTSSQADDTTASPSSGTSTATGDGTTTADTEAICPTVQCDFGPLACSDGVDNDGDGLIDLEDPMCTSPCDDLEDAWGHGLPTDNGFCSEDCYFDGNTGHGDDLCRSDLICDPQSPGARIGCPYAPESGPCTAQGFPIEQPGRCRDFCEPRTLPGCDCFGCCALDTPSGTFHIMLEYGGEDCTAQTPEACTPCTPQIEQCGNPCEGCEICFGRTEPAEGCETHTCDFGPTCADSCDCPDDDYCYNGCCYPIPAW